MATRFAGHANGFRAHDYGYQHGHNDNVYVEDSQPEEPNHVAVQEQDEEQPDSYPFGADSYMQQSQQLQSQASTFQATQEITQSQMDRLNSDAATEAPPHASPILERWGMLIPAEGNRNPACKQVILESSDPYAMHTVGRTDKYVYEGVEYPNDLIIRSPMVSSCHCKLWRIFDPTVRNSYGYAIVMIEDNSTNGTYLRGEKIGKGNSKILLPFQEFSVGPTYSNGIPKPQNDFRYQYIPLLQNGQQMRKKRPGEAGGLYEKYELFQPIGKGSFATVHKAVDRTTGEWRAVKIINKEKFRGNAQTMIMIEREVAIMQSVYHRYIVSYIDGYEDESRLYLVMELVEGGDLLDFISARGGLEEDEAAEIALMVCEAVSYLHQKGIAHRDLKPENLLLTTGDNPVCKVADFGLAKLSTEFSQLRTMCGTPSYLAPEVVLQKKESPGYNFAVDAWSIGVIIYSALANSSPFEEDETVALHIRMMNRKPDMSYLHQIGCSREAIDFVAKFLIIDPARRMTPYSALAHPWLSTCLRRRESSGVNVVSMLKPTPPAAGEDSQSQPMPQSQPKPQRILPLRSELLRDENASQASSRTPSLARGDSGITDPWAMTANRSQMTDDNDSGNLSDAPSSHSYSQRMGNLRIRSDFDVDHTGPDLDDQAREKLSMELTNDSEGTIPSLKSMTGTPLSQSLKRKEPPSRFSSEASMDSGARLQEIAQESSVLTGPSTNPTTASASMNQPTPIKQEPSTTRTPESPESSDLSSLSSSDSEAEDASDGGEEQATTNRRRQAPRPRSTKSTTRINGSQTKSKASVRSMARPARKSARSSVINAPSYLESDDDAADQSISKSSIRSMRARKQRRVSVQP